MHYYLDKGCSIFLEGVHMSSESQRKAVKKYNEKLDEVRFRVQKGELEAYKLHAAQQNESLAQFMRRAADETIERDNNNNK